MTENENPPTGRRANGNDSQDVFDPLTPARLDPSKQAIDPAFIGTNVLDDVRRVSPDVHFHWASVADQIGNREATDELLHLLHQVVEHTKSAPPVIQFVGVEGGEGASTIAVLFANAAVDVGVGRVLLFSDVATEIENENGDTLSKTHANMRDGHISAAPHNSADSVGSDVKPLDRNDNRGLYICPMLSLTEDDAGSPPNLRPETGDILNAMRSHFRLILVDSGPVTTEKNSLRISRSVDGVILVIEAEKTSTARARGAIKRIRGAGGNLLGAILNRKRSLLPKLLVGQL